MADEEKGSSVRSVEAGALFDTRPMTEADLGRLKPGSVLRHEDGVHGYVVTAGYGDHLVITRTTKVTHPAEWLVAQEVL